MYGWRTAQELESVVLKINFLRPVWQAQLTAEGTVEQRPHDRIRRVQHKRRTEPIGCENNRVVLRDQKAAGE